MSNEQNPVSTTETATTEAPVARKRKERSDKGKKRGPRKAKVESNTAESN